MLENLLGRIAAILERSQSSRLGWLKTHFLDVVAQRQEPNEPLPRVERNSSEFGSMLESLTKLEGELAAAKEAVHDSVLKHEGLLAKVSKKQKEYSAALDELQASEEENKPLKLKVQQLTRDVTRHREAIDQATEPPARPDPPPPPLTPAPANLASASPGAASSASAPGSAAPMPFMAKVAAIKGAFGLDAAMQAVPALTRAKELIGLVGPEMGNAAATQIMQFLGNIASIRREFQLDESTAPADVIKKANEQCGLIGADLTSTLAEQVEAIMRLIE